MGRAVSESVIGDAPYMACLTTLQQEQIHCGPDRDAAACLPSRKVQLCCGGQWQLQTKLLREALESRGAKRTTFISKLPLKEESGCS